MRIAYTTDYDAHNIRNWSGTGTAVARSLEAQQLQLEYLGPLKYPSAPFAELKRKLYRRLFHLQYLDDFSVATQRSYGLQIMEKLKTVHGDVIFGTHSHIFSFCESNLPIVFWSDSTFAGLVNFYADYSHLCGESLRAGNRVERLGLERCRLAIYASDWAAQSAIRDYGVDPAKVKVVPYGANLQSERTYDDIKRMLAQRSRNICKLIFIGKVWERKGGDVALAVVKQLNESGVRAELTLVGSQPPAGIDLPPYVRNMGFISKAKPEGQQLFDSLVAESHFLILPTQAECYGVAFCEASSFGVPSLTTNVGGVPTVVKDGVNGKTFSLRAPIAEYSRYVGDLMQNYSMYEQLALSAYNEYQTRLNWRSAGEKVKQLLTEII